MNRENEFTCLFGHNILEIILAKKTTELVLFFHKDITKLVFLWPNMRQKYFKVLISKGVKLKLMTPYKLVIHTVGTKSLCAKIF